MMTQTPTTRLVRLTATAFGAAALLTACGGADRPSVDQISTAISKAKLPSSSMSTKKARSVTACVARAYHDSDLSNEFLSAMVENDNDFDPSEKDERIFTDTTTKTVTACSGAGGTDPASD